MVEKSHREVLTFKLSREDLALMGKAVGKLAVTTDVDTSAPGAFTIRNHSFSTDKPGAFTIRNHSFNTQSPGAFTIRNYQFSSVE
ncbi:MAG: hypothetical protein JWQ01_1993 [Massilia sp.]|nr:hypothetical protein [Massilia sp.]